MARFAKAIEEAIEEATSAFGVATIACVGGAILGVLVALAVVAAGNTFGQRCAAAGYDRNSESFRACVRDLKGK